MHDDIEHQRHARDLVSILEKLHIESAEQLIEVAPVAMEFPELMKMYEEARAGIEEALPACYIARTSR